MKNASFATMLLMLLMLPLWQNRLVSERGNVSVTPEENQPSPPKENPQPPQPGDGRR